MHVNMLSLVKKTRFSTTNISVTFIKTKFTSYKKVLPPIAQFLVHSITDVSGLLDQLFNEPKTALSLIK